MKRIGRLTTTTTVPPTPVDTIAEPAAPRSGQSGSAYHEDESPAAGRYDVQLWCRCGGWVKATTKSQHWTAPAGVRESFRAMHYGEGHTVTDDPERGRKWSRAARRRERASRVVT